MMHISEGVVSGPVLLTGAALSLTGIFLGLRKIESKDIPKVAVLSSSFFVASLIHIPLGPSSVHLVLNGLIGVLLGWTAFPSIFIALILQALLFQFGGFTVLGVNTFSMAMPGVISFYSFRKVLKMGKGYPFIAGFLAGAFSVILGAIFISIALIETEKNFIAIAGTLLSIHLPIAGVEGIITGFILSYLYKVKPEVI